MTLTQKDTIERILMEKGIEFNSGEDREGFHYRARKEGRKVIIRTEEEARRV